MSGDDTGPWRRGKREQRTIEEAREQFEIHHEMTYHEMCDVLAGLRADILVLRTALQALYDATGPVTKLLLVVDSDAWWRSIEEARAAAGVVLGGGNE